MTAKTDAYQIGVSVTPANNFTLVSDAAGGMKLARGNPGATTQDILSVTPAGAVKQSRAVRNLFSAYLPASFGVIPINTWTLVRTYTEIIDSANTFEPTTNGRYQPNVPGWYMISAGVSMIGDPGSIAAACIFKNNSNFRRVGGTVTTGTNSNVAVAGAFPIYLNGTTDYLDVRVYLNGTNTYVYGDAAGEFTTFSGYLIEAD